MIKQSDPRWKTAREAERVEFKDRDFFVKDMGEGGFRILDDRYQLLGYTTRSGGEHPLHRAKNIGSQALLSGVMEEYFRLHPGQRQAPAKGAVQPREWKPLATKADVALDDALELASKVLELRKVCPPSERAGMHDQLMDCSDLVKKLLDTLRTVADYSKSLAGEKG